MIITGGQLMCLLKYKKKAFGTIMVKIDIKCIVCREIDNSEENLGINIG